MARFAKLGINGKVVGVHVVNDTDCQTADGVEAERVGQDFLQHVHGWDASMWKRTSYWTHNGKHWTFTDNGDGTVTWSESIDQSKSFRKNHASIGDIYDEVRDAFYKPQPYVSWTLNETTCQWEPPTPQPSLTAEEKAANKSYEWNESTKAWDLIS